MQNFFIAKKIWDRKKKLGPPFGPQEISGPPFYQPHRKACKFNFYWKICGNFFKASLTRVKNFKGTLFAPGPQQVFVNGSLDR